MTTVELPHAFGSDLKLPDWTVEQRDPIWRRLTRRLLATREIGILTIIALVGYSFAGWWMFYVQHFYINDELSRTADAVYTTVGRDPHLGAIGFFWPPLPQLVDSIFMPIVEQFGSAVMAGTLQTAFCMAFTIPVLAQIGRSLGVGRWTTFAICVAFAANPVSIYNSTNGMSESAFFLTGALTMLGFFRFIRSRSTGDMILFSLAMSAFILTRLEGPVVDLVLVAVAAFEWRCMRSWKTLKQSTWTAVLLGLPPLCCFLFWILVQWILLKDPLFFLHQAVPPLTGQAAWLPNYQHHKLEVLAAWSLNWVLELGLVIGVALVGVLVRPFSNRTRGSIGIVGAMAVILVIQIDQVGFGGGYGDPRYFSMAVPWAACAALWLASRTRETPLNPLPSPAPWAGAWNLFLIAILVLNMGTGNRTMSNGHTTAIEHECTFFQGDVAKLIPFLGVGGKPGTEAYCGPPPNNAEPYQLATHWLDKRLEPRDRVLTDNSVVVAPDLFTRHPNQFIVRNDRDWEKIVANPSGRFDYIITEAARRRAPPEQGGTGVGTGAVAESEDYGAVIINIRPGAWKLVYETNGGKGAKPGARWAQVYELSGKIPPAGINAPTGQLAQ